MRIWSYAILLSLTSALLAGCAANSGRPEANAAPPIALSMSIQSTDKVVVTYILAKPTAALHYAQYLGGYRSEDWQPGTDGFRWVKEGDGERIERTDGKPFGSVSLTIPMRYRSLPKSYAPFSPFSEGSVLMHSGQFHACADLPCDGTAAMPIKIAATGRMIGVGGRRIADETSFVSANDGTKVFVGSLAPVDADGFIAIIDPGLPVGVRDHLQASLPRAMRDLASVYGTLSFRPELYVSIDSRPGQGGKESTQGGVLPNQVFMHFDGASAGKRVSQGSPFWLDWFFAHEAAHLFQQDQSGGRANDDRAGWIHEGGADALAALSLAKRGDKEMAYVLARVAKAEIECAAGLASAPLDQATASGKFDLHYQCGVLIWLALDADLRGQQKDGLHALNKAFFLAVRTGTPWNEQSFIDSARKAGVSRDLIETIAKLSHGGYTNIAAEVAALRKRGTFASSPT